MNEDWVLNDSNVFDEKNSDRAVEISRFIKRLDSKKPTRENLSMAERYITYIESAMKLHGTNYETGTGLVPFRTVFKPDDILKLKKFIDSANT